MQICAQVWPQQTENPNITSYLRAILLLLCLLSLTFLALLPSSPSFLFSARPLRLCQLRPERHHELIVSLSLLHDSLASGTQRSLYIKEKWDWLWKQRAVSIYATDAPPAGPYHSVQQYEVTTAAYRWRQLGLVRSWMRERPRLINLSLKKSLKQSNGS